MHSISRRAFLQASLTVPVVLTSAAPAEPPRANVHEQILELAAKLQARRRKLFAGIQTKDQLIALQADLRRKFLELLDGLPGKKAAPPVEKTGRIEGDEYVVEKLVYQSFPQYFVPALLYKPKKLQAPAPAILSPCGHAPIGKADVEYQKLHINLAKRGYIVLTYDPVGQGERSQFWDVSRRRSRFNLSCGEHAVLGNPLYLLGTSLARYRIWDGMRGIDYLTSLAEVDARRIGCVGNSGGGTLTAYISALDTRVRVAVISCYITTLPRRMANRVQEDPDADPEQDIFGFVSEGIDHAGLLALRVPKPTLVNAARYDFFPIEGARESFAEAKRLYELLDAGEGLGIAEATEKHGLTLPLRQAAYGWFDRWLSEQREQPRVEEIPVTPRRPQELHVCREEQVQLSFQSRELLPLACEEFEKRKKPRPVGLKTLLKLDPELADFHLSDESGPEGNGLHVLCINGVEAQDWRLEKDFLQGLRRERFRVSVIDPRGVGRMRPALEVKGHEYADPLAGVEENIAYNTFLVGKSLLGMRVSDVLAAVTQLRAKTNEGAIVLCGRRDSALTACLASALEGAVSRVAVEEMLLSYWPLFEARGRPINAASVVPRMLRDFGDVADVVAALAPRPVLMAVPVAKRNQKMNSVRVIDKRFTSEPELLIRWLRTQ
jgi:dienelactone hydrolase